MASKKEIVVELRLEDKGALDKLGGLTIQTKKYQEELKKLNADIKANGFATKEQTRQIGELTARIRANQAVTRELKNDLSGATAAGLRFRDVMRQATVGGLGAFGVQALGVTAAAAALGTALRDAVKTIADFQQGNANLASILGLSRKEITELTASAIALGPALGRLPEEVTKLQTELAKLGFTVPQILAAQEAIIQLSNATGEGLAKSAEVAASTLKGFDLTAEDTQRIVDVMAQSFNSTSLDLERFSVAMATLAPAAKAAGFSLENTTALIGVLSDRGLDASTVGTSLRSIFIDLANKGIKLEDALAEINGSTNKTATAFKLFGERAAGAAVILAENIDQSDALKTAFDNAGGAAEKMATEQLNTLVGASNQVKASWDALIFSLDSGEGFISTTLRATLQGLAGDFKAIGEAQNAFELFGLFMDRTTSLSLQARAALEAQTKAQQDATKAAQDFLTIEGAQTKTLDQLNARLETVVKHQQDYASVGKDNVAAEFAFEAAIIRTAIALKGEGDALTTNANTFTTVAQKRQALTESLAKEKAAREALEVTDKAGIAAANANIEAIQREITALDGLTEAQKKAAKAAQEARNARAEAIPERLEPITTDASSQATPLPLTPEAQSAAELAAQQYQLLQEQIRADEILGIIDFNAQRQALDDEYFRQKSISLQEYNSRKQELDEQSLELELNNQRATIGAAADLFAGLSQLAEEGSAEFKALATSQALINTYLGATVALTDRSLPNAFARIASAIAVIATGLASVKKIQGFEDGGYTGKRKSNKEAVGVVHANEWVAPAEMVEDPVYGPIIDWLEANRHKGRTSSTSGYLTGGPVRGTALVNLPSAPRPSPGEIIAVEQMAETRAQTLNAEISIVEINKVQNRVKVREGMSTA